MTERPEGERPAEGSTVAEVGEFGLIRRVTEGREPAPGTLLGPGDDAAVVAAPDGRVAVSTDLLVEGVHFRLDWSSPEQVGRKAAAVNMADLAAMGARPTALVVGLACPPGTATAVADELTAGLWREAAATGAGVVGGDVVSAPQLMISVTALGDLEGRAPVTRAGARPGDWLAVRGRPGWAAAGLAVLRRGFRTPVDIVAAQRVPAPPYAAGPGAARAGATAMIDTSDGLLADLGHVAEASGVGFAVRSTDLPLAPKLADVSAALGEDPVRWMLTGGEDHALLATFPPATPLPPGWHAIGVAQVAAGIRVDGRPWDGAAGWDHFAGPGPGRA